MQSNPFVLPTAYLADQQQKRRERVKITFYTAVGALVVFCLASLIQGCKTHRTLSELPSEIALGMLSSQSESSSSPLLEKSNANAGAAQPAALRESAAATTPMDAPLAPAASPQPALKDISYVIKSGDSLTGIAKAHRTTVLAIKAANDLTTDRLAVGRKLKIPGA